MIIRWIKNKYRCFKEGHIWAYDSPALGGDWIRCTRCHILDEYLPGTHEPKGYDYDGVHFNWRERIG